MGTRSHVHFLNSNETVILSLYNQYDGYILNGVGETIVSVISKNQNLEIEKLAVLILMALEKNHHGTYIIEGDIDEREEFTYILNCEDLEVWLTCFIGDKKIYHGRALGFLDAYQEINKPKATKVSKLVNVDDWLIT